MAAQTGLPEGKIREFHATKAVAGAGNGCLRPVAPARSAVNSRRYQLPCGLRLAAQDMLGQMLGVLFDP